jgi:Synergist-CTERM protein sorting domain-containing protein
MSLVKVAIVLCCIVLPATARAQVVFPPDAAWTPLRCNRAPMTDRFQDQLGALDERDIVGNAAAPAGLRAADATYLYLRMRLEEDPAPGGAVRPSAWGMQFDLDGDLKTYELMVAVSGVASAAGTVSLYRNNVTTRLNDPSDSPDLPAVAVSSFAGDARSVVAPGSNNGGNADFFLDFAVPWSALVPLGLDRDTATYIWAATSSVATSFDGDVACHDGASGAALLDGTASDLTTGDPAQDPGPGPGGTGRLEGGGGCTAGGAGSPGTALALLAFVALRRRRRTAL